MNEPKNVPVMYDVERYQPERWEDIVGNDEIKDYCFDLLHGVRKRKDRSGYNSLITGPSRSGKTSAISLLIKAIGCVNFDFETFNPCHDCENCKQAFHLYGHGEWSNYIDLLGNKGTAVPVNYQVIDCSRLTESDIEECIGRLRYGTDMLQVVHLDETHHLVKRSMDEKFLKPMETFPAIWIATTAMIKRTGSQDYSKLDKMFQNRFSYRLNTKKPSLDQMMLWLIDRCEQFGIVVDQKSTLNELAVQSKYLPGMALHVLNKAHKSRKRTLTRALVDGHIYDIDE